MVHDGIAVLCEYCSYDVVLQNDDEMRLQQPGQPRALMLD